MFLNTMFDHLKTTPKVTPLLGAWMGLQVADVSTTYYILQTGGVEVNPIVAGGLALFGFMFWPIKIAIGYWSGLMLQSSSKWFKIAIASMVGLVAWNSLQIILY